MSTSLKIEFLERIKEKARKNPQIIVFPESAIDERTLRATIQIAKEKFAYPMLLGDPASLNAKIKEINGSVPSEIGITDNTISSKQKDYYIEQLLEIRKNKGLTLEEATKKLESINYFGVMMVAEGHAQGLISGACVTTAGTMIPALEIIKPKEKFHKASGYFLMLLQNRTMLFADCAMNINPNSHDLAGIALDTAETAKRFGLTPKVAFLSFQTNGSSRHPESDKVREAVAIAKSKNTEILMEGEMQVDCALVPEVAKIKWPESQIAGRANVLIFPNLESGNIAYKLVERLAGAEAIGPIIQGLNKPINDLSRGCSIEDIINLAAVTSIEAQNMDFN